MNEADRGFGIGASHAAGWIAEAVRALEAAKASTSEITRTVEDYMNVLVDWRQEQVEMPKGNPWSWSYRGTPGLYQASKEGMVKRLRPRPMMLSGCARGPIRFSLREHPDLQVGGKLHPVPPSCCASAAPGLRPDPSTLRAAEQILTTSLSAFRLVSPCGVSYWCFAAWRGDGRVEANYTQPCPRFTQGTCGSKCLTTHKLSSASPISCSSS